MDVVKLAHSLVTFGTCFTGIFQYEVQAFINGSLDLVRVRIKAAYNLYTSR